MIPIDRLGWADSTALRVGQYVVGVRTDVAGSTAKLAERFADVLTPLASAGPNYSFQGTTSAGGKRSFGVLYFGCSMLAVTRDDDDLLDILAEHLDRTLLPTVDGLVPSQVRAWSKGHAVVLTTPGLVEVTSPTAARLRRAGYRHHQVPLQLLDGRRQLMVRARVRIGGIQRDDRGMHGYKIAGLLAEGLPTMTAAQECTKGEAVHKAARAVPHLEGRDPQEVLDALASIFEQSPAYVVPPKSFELERAIRMLLP